MKKSRKFNINPLILSDNSDRGQLSLKYFSTLKGILYTGIFHVSNIYNEKLPIIYANIRV